MQDYRVVLAMTVDCRRDANRRMIAALDNVMNPDTKAYNAAHELHERAARIARKYGVS